MNTTCGFESISSLPAFKTASKRPQGSLSLQREPGVRLEALLGPVAVVVEQLLAVTNLEGWSLIIFGAFLTYS